MLNLFEIDGNSSETSLANPVKPMDNLDSLRKIGRNDFTLNELVTQLKSNKGVMPFVGAGLSIPFGFKGWQEFLLAQANYAGVEKKIKQRIKRGEYEEAAQDLLTALAPLDFQDALSSEYGVEKLGKVSLEGAVSFLPILSNGPVITTNFDRVLEKVFDDSGARFEEIIWGAKVQITLKAISQNKRYLLKLHGDVEDDTDRVLTLREYSKHYGRGYPSRIDLEKPLPGLLQTLLTNRPVLFLGCSLNNDRVVKLLKHMAGTRRNLPHYAVVECPSPAAFARSRLHFAKHGIRPIWYPQGEHRFVEMIVEFLCNEIDDAPPLGTSKQPRKNHTLAPGMKATEGLELIIKQLPEIASFFIVRYKNKRRLPERTPVQLADDPARFLAQATIHNDEDDQKEEVPLTKLNQSFWKRQFDGLQEDFVLAASSKVKLRDGTTAHIPMMDFKCAPTSSNVEVAKEGFAKIGQTDGVLLNSGNSFHYYGRRLLSETEWHEFLGHSLLLSDFIDTRYVGHALINDECRLRLSTTRLNPFIPTIVEIF